MAKKKAARSTKPKKTKKLSEEEVLNDLLRICKGDKKLLLGILERLCNVPPSKVE